MVLALFHCIGVKSTNLKQKLGARTVAPTSPMGSSSSPGYCTSDPAPRTMHENHCLGRRGRAGDNSAPLRVPSRPDRESPASASPFWLRGVHVVVHARLCAVCIYANHIKTLFAKGKYFTSQ